MPNEVAVDDRTYAEHAGPAFVRSQEHPESLAQYIARLVGLNPDGEVHLVDRFGRRSSASYGALFRRALALSSRLPNVVAGEAPTAIICVTGALDFIVGAWACLLAGLDLFPFDTALALTNADEFRRRLEGARTALGNSIILADAGLFRAITRSSDEAAGSIIGIEEAVSGSLLPTAEYSAAARQSRLLISTSGTGGEPKIAVIDNVSATNRFFDFYRQDDRSCLYTMAHHSVAGIRLLLPLGRRVVYLHPLRLAADPAEWFRAVEDHRITDVGLSSSMAAMLCDAIAKGDASQRNLRSLERISFGAEVIVPQVLKQLLVELKDRVADQCQVSLVYSMTETGPIYRSIMPLERIFKQLETVSEPIVLEDCVRGWSVRCVDASGRVVGEGEAGTVQVRSDSKLFAGYYAARPGGVASQWKTGEWFSTGDVAVMSNGKLTLKGREKSTIIVNARKVTSEEIETRLRANRKLKSLNVIVAAFRDEPDVTDAVAAFVVVPDHATIDFPEVRTEIVADVSRYFGLSVRHVVPITEDDVDRTTTMKVRRDLLVEKYKQGGITGKTAPRSMARLSDHATFLRMWQEALDLEAPPGLDADFFELGGDSLAAARLFAAAESAFSRLIDVDEFFSDPTPRHLLELIARSPLSSRQGDAVNGTGVLQSMASYVASWKGDRLSKDSMVVGFNVEGKRPPIFWVFQGHQEASALSAALGPDQPVYALRSAHEILPPADYSEEVLREVVDRYFWEILAVAKERAFSLGGNCQGGMIALILARRFGAIGRKPKALFLAEWYRDFGRYDGPVRIILCEQSPMWAGLDIADVQAHQSRFFPRGKVEMIPVGYAQAVTEGTVRHLASILERDLADRKAARWLKWLRARWRGG